MTNFVCNDWRKNALNHIVCQSYKKETLSITVLILFLLSLNRQISVEEKINGLHVQYVNLPQVPFEESSIIEKTTIYMRNCLLHWIRRFKCLKKHEFHYLTLISTDISNLPLKKAVMISRPKKMILQEYRILILM